MEDLWEHKESHRDSDINFTCVICGKRFLEFSQIAKHSLLHNTPTVIKGFSAHENWLSENWQEFLKKHLPKAVNENISDSMNTESNVNTKENERFSPSKHWKKIISIHEEFSA